MEIGKKLKQIREMANLSQKEVAEKAGISQAYYSEIENGKEKIRCPIDTLSSICSALGISLSEFFKDDKELLKSYLPPEYVDVVKYAREREVSPEQLKSVIDLIRKA
ncbi:MAG: helix-turn-helix domain-containing protein [Caulobacteraceae bacterium]